MEEELGETSARNGDGDGLFPSLFKRKGAATAESHGEAVTCARNLPRSKRNWKS